MEDSYLLGEQTNIPATYAFQISDLDLNVLELKNSNSVESDIEEHQRPFEEGVNRVGYFCQSNPSLLIEGLNVPPATLFTLCWIKK